MNTNLCKFCCKECKNENSIRNHERLCKLNPEKQKSNLENRCNTTPWNKGLTKDTDSRLLLHSVAVKETMQTLFDSGYRTPAHNTYWTDARRKQRSDWRKQLHIDHPEMHPNRRLAGNRNKMTYPEKVAFDYLSGLGISFEHQPQIGKYFPDFLIGDIIIEIDGAQWHCTEKDQVRDTALTSLGYKVFRIDSKERIEHRIKEILGH